MRKALLCAGLVAACVLPGAALAQTPANKIRAGHEIAQKFCGHCHAIGLEGKSAHADAPPFRTIAAKGNMENLEEALGEGIIAGHPDMPQFQFKPGDVGALAAYLKSLSGKG
jgi:cytochrome c